MKAEDGGIQSSALLHSPGEDASAPQGSPEDFFEVAIVGGGPAGSALASVLARAGRQVTVFERDEFPRDKLCGEFLSGEARRLLEQIGCLEALLREGPARIHGSRFTTASGKSVEVPLPAEAFGVSRKVLDAVLIRHASQCGASVFTRTDVRSVVAEDSGPMAAKGALLEIRQAGAGGEVVKRRVRAGLVVGAYGRREPLDKQMGRRFLEAEHPFAGLKRHCLPAAGSGLVEELRGHVEIHAFEGGYCGLSAVETGEINVCMLLEKRFLKGLASTRWEPLLEALSGVNPFLRSRLSALKPADDAVHSVGQVPFSSRERSLWPLVFVGDAAGMIAPVCGDGQAMALRSALLLGELIAPLPAVLSRADFERLGRKWDSAWRTEFQRRFALGRRLQSFLLKARTADLAIRLVRTFPALGRHMARATRG